MSGRRRLDRWFSLTLLTAAAILGGGVSGLSQGRVKVGDRVENVQTGSEKGTVKQVGTGDYKDCYLVLFDYQKGTGAKGNWVCTHGQPNILFLLDRSDRRVADVNAAGGEGGEGGEGVTERVEKKAGGIFGALRKNLPGGGNLPGGKGPLPQAGAGGARQREDAGARGADAEAPPQCAGELLLSPNRAKSRAAGAALFKDVIKSLWDKENDPGKENGRRVTTVTSLTVGAAYRWTPNVDFQSLGTKPKTVYPVKAKYTTCTTGLLQWTVMESTNEEIYSCYVEDEFGEWTCAIRKAGEFKRTSVDNAEGKKVKGL
jgi:hypothetical protein